LRYLISAVLGLADLAIGALCFAMAWLFWRKQFLELYQAARREVLLQFGRSE
jgi:hypothetical protein